MLNTDEQKIEKEINDNIDQNINNNKKNEIDNSIKKDLIKFLETQLKESEKEITEKEITTEKEIMIVHNRLNKEIEKSIKFSLEKLIINFLPVIDNIKRASDLIQKNQSQECYIEILKKLQHVDTILKDCFILFNIKKIDDVNISFDPSIHQAMSIHYTNEIPSNKIVTVMQPGYMLHEHRLLRPAMVIVSKKKI